MPINPIGAPAGSAGRQQSVGKDHRAVRAGGRRSGPRGSPDGGGLAPTQRIPGQAPRSEDRPSTARAAVEAGIGSSDPGQRGRLRPRPGERRGEPAVGPLLGQLAGIAEHDGDGGPAHLQHWLVSAPTARNTAVAAMSVKARPRDGPRPKPTASAVPATAVPAGVSANRTVRPPASPTTVCRPARRRLVCPTSRRSVRPPARSSPHQPRHAAQRPALGRPSARALDGWSHRQSPGPVGRVTRVAQP